MQKLPTPDRIALARELLEGTGRVVPREVDHMDAPGDMSAPQALGWAKGWNACRAAMLGGDDAP